MKRTKGILAVILATLLGVLSGCGGASAPAAQNAATKPAITARALASDVASGQVDVPTYADVP